MFLMRAHAMLGELDLSPELLFLGVAIALAVIFYDGLRGGLGGMVRAILQPVAWNALLLSLWTAGVMAVINAVMGTLTAYVLVRYSFPGKRLLNGLIEASATVTSALRAAETRGRMTPLKKAPLVPTK